MWRKWFLTTCCTQERTCSPNKAINDTADAKGSQKNGTLRKRIALEAQLSAQCCRENLPVTSQTALHWTATRTSIPVLFNKALKTLFHLILFALPEHIIIITGYHTHSLKSLFFLQIQQFSHRHGISKIISYIISSHAAALLSVFTSLFYCLCLHRASNCWCSSVSVIEGEQFASWVWESLTVFRYRGVLIYVVICMWYVWLLFSFFVLVHMTDSTAHISEI